ncbi:MAG: ATP-dependent DNA helicase RecG [Leptospiraceae bacterium]|nr:ATP-dependent DNA helicase RecG [Leptospiraceae bacterium]
MKTISLDSDISVIKGIGPKKKIVLNQIGIYKLIDLLYYFPRKYLDRNFTESVLLKDGEHVTLLTSVTSSYLAHGKRSRLIVSTRTNRGEVLTLVFFKGIQFFKNKFLPNLNIVVSGKLDYFKGFQIVHPEFEILDDENEEFKLTHLGGIIPLYPSNEVLKEENLDSKGFRRIIKQTLDILEQSNVSIPEIIPEKFIAKRKLVGREKAITEMHFPESFQALQDSRRRIAYEELYLFSLLMEYKRIKRENFKRILWALPKSESAIIVEKSLPYQLTDDQRKAIKDMIESTQTDRPVACLLQGDVGSGKTITALLIALHYTDNDVQVCMIAPTEILARQHFSTFRNLLGNNLFFGIDLFLGKESEKVRKEKIARLKNKETMIAVGTHSLLSEDVTFVDMGLVIIDEQHKFGVEQRETLRSKGKNPDVLATTATPIPRTLCLTLYGDLNLLTIKSKPKGRKPIVTKWIRESKREAVHNSIRKYILQGRQAYIVYPVIEESENQDLKSCIEAFEELKKTIFKEFNIGLLHGRLKTAEKEFTMDLFKRNEIQILVTTTVVEVGVDVPNATVLVIENADRFGISQLHQLRGRVGRGEHESFCIMLTKDFVSDDAKVRLEAMEKTNDGFELSEVDLKLRGPGELLGIRQSGLPDFKVADLQSDMSIIAEAREDASDSIEQTKILSTEIENRFAEGKILFAN